MRERIARQNTRWTIIDGGRTSDQNDDYSIPGPLGINKFVDGVMEQIELESSNQDLPETETIVEFCDPKKLPRLSVVEIQPEIEERSWNIRNFFRRK
jgi:hypothetical protein